MSYDILNFVVDSLLSNFSALNDFDQRTMAPSEFGIPFFLLSCLAMECINARSRDVFMQKSIFVWKIVRPSENDFLLFRFGR